MNTGWGYYVWIPFGDLMHEDKPGTWFARGAGDPAWWSRRAEILARYTLRSLRLQEWQGFRVVFGIPTEAEKISGPVREIAARDGAEVFVHPLRDPLKDGQGAAREGILSLLERHREGVVMIHVDSDDMFARTALKQLSGERAEDGLVMFFSDGYALEEKTGRLWTYCPGRCPAPFFARCWGKDAGRDFYRYAKAHGYLGQHHELLGCERRRQFDDGEYLVLMHGSNTTTGLQKPATSGKLKREITDAKEKARILERFGQ